jgi:hypothetical protein
MRSSIKARASFHSDLAFCTAFSVTHIASSTW